MADITFNQRSAGDVAVIDFNGKLVLTDETEGHRRELTALIDSAPKVLLNLGGITYIDSMGIGLLVGAKTSAINRRVALRMCSPAPLVAKLLAMLHLTRVLDVYPDEPSALASLEQPQDLPTPAN